jgi:hypothetical protein
VDAVVAILQPLATIYRSASSNTWLPNVDLVLALVLALVSRPKYTCWCHAIGHHLPIA